MFLTGILCIFSVVLGYILDNWNSVSSKLDRKLFLNMLRSFSITNDELASQGRNSQEGFAECTSACKVRYSWQWLWDHGHLLLFEESFSYFLVFKNVSSYEICLRYLKDFTYLVTDCSDFRFIGWWCQSVFTFWLMFVFKFIFSKRLDLELIDSQWLAPNQLFMPTTCKVCRGASSNWIFCQSVCL